MKDIGCHSYTTIKHIPIITVGVYFRVYNLLSDEGRQNSTENSLLLLNYDVFLCNNLDNIKSGPQGTVQSKKKKNIHDTWLHLYNIKLKGSNIIPFYRDKYLTGYLYYTTI